MNTATTTTSASTSGNHHQNRQHDQQQRHSAASPSRRTDDEYPGERNPATAEPASEVVRALLETLRDVGSRCGNGDGRGRDGVWPATCDRSRTASGFRWQA